MSKKFHGIKLSPNSVVSNVNIERLISDPPATVAGRIWYNTTEKKIKFTTYNTENNIVIYEVITPESISVSDGIQNINGILSLKLDGQSIRCGDDGLKINPDSIKSNFKDLLDVPSTYGSPGNIVVVNDDATGLKYSTIPSNYTLPKASDVILGGIKIGTGLNIDVNGVVSITPTDNNFTDEDRLKLDSIQSGASNYTLPTATDIILGGVKVGSRITIVDGSISADIQTDNNFDNTYKSKLDNIESGAINYTLPTASDTILGGVKIGSGITINDGIISASGGTSNVTTFKDLTDVPQSYIGNVGKTLIVNQTENGLIYTQVSTGSSVVSFSYSSSTPNITHTVTHNLNTYQLIWGILVQDPVTSEWSNDDVKIVFTDANTATIQLIRSSNLKANFLKV